MATYPTLTSFTEKQLVYHTDMNNILDAIDIIRSPGRYYYLKSAGDADLTISSTTMADLAAQFTVASLDTSGNPVRIMLYAGRQTTTATFTQFDLLIDGISVRGGTPVWRGVTNVPVMLTWVADGLSAGTHSYKIQWNINGAGTSTIYPAYGIWFEIREE